MERYPFSKLTRSIRYDCDTAADDCESLGGGHRRHQGLKLACLRFSIQRFQEDRCQGKFQKVSVNPTES